jgi:GntR family transcriptional regulator
MTLITARPLYLRVRDALAERITRFEWKPGTVLQNESDLAREFGVSSGTVRKALDLMKEERLITRRQGRGTVVNDQTSNELAIRYSNIRGTDGERIAGQVELAEVAEGTANDAECARLQLHVRDPVYRVHRVRFHEDQPFMIEQASMPRALFPALEANNISSQGIVALAQQNGILLGKAEERISIGMAAEVVAKALRVSPNAPVMVLDRVLLTRVGRPVEWRLAHCHLLAKHYFAEMG